MRGIRVGNLHLVQQSMELAGAMELLLELQCVLRKRSVRVVVVGGRTDV